MKYSNCFSRWLTLASFAAGAGMLRGQDPATAPNSSSRTSDEIEVLSPFIVDGSNDKGYRATNSISGTRLSTPIKEVPMPIEVITDEFIQDIGANNFREALSYSAGVILNSQNDAGANDFNARGGNSGVRGVQGDPSESAIKLRGFTTTEQLQSGFKRAQATDSIGIGRVEVVRGPAALLYGTGNFGGIVNVIPKRPTASPFLRLSAQAGSNELYRGEFDASSPLGNAGTWLGQHHAGIRVMSALTNSGDWTDFNTTKRGVFNAIAEVEPFKDTRVNVNFEQGFNHRYGIGFQKIYDNFSQDANDIVDVPTLPSPRQRTYRWSGPDTFQENFYWHGMAEVEQRIGKNLTIVAGVDVSESDYGLRSLAVDGLPANEGPVEFRTTYKGFSNLSLKTHWTKGENNFARTQTRVELSYRFNLAGTSNNILLGRTDGTYDISKKSFVATPNYRRLDDYSYFRFVDGAQSYAFAKDETNTNWDQGIYSVYQGKFFHDRITTVSGVRYDRSDTRRVGRSAAGAVTSNVRRPNNQPTDATTLQFGVTYKVNEAISVYALRSGGVNPNYYDLDGAGNTFDPTDAISKEIGVKFDLIKGKLSGTVSAFRIDRSNTTRSLTWVPNPVRNDTRIGADKFDPTKPISYALNVSAARGHDTYFPWLAGLAGTRVFFYPNESVNGSNPAVDRAHLEEFFNSKYAGDASQGIHASQGNNASKNRGAFVAVDDRSEGFDTQLVFTPTKAWSFVASYAYLDRFITRGAQAFIGQPGETPWEIWYVKAGRANFGTVGDASTYNGNYAQGLRLDDTPFHQASLWNKYSFLNGQLKNLEIGGGATWLSPREYRTSAEGSGSGSIAGPSYTSDEWTVDALVRYRWQVGRHDWSVQLNVNNVLDDQSLIGDLYKAPRTWRLTFDMTY